MPDLDSFKESGDIEYSADNAIILQPNWNLLDPLSTQERKSTLWLVASRENSPGKVGEYMLDFPLGIQRAVGPMPFSTAFGYGCAWLGPSRHLRSRKQLLDQVGRLAA